MVRKDPIQTARFGHETTGRDRVLILHEKHLSRRILAIAPDAIRFVVIVNESGEVQSLDDIIDCLQVTWSQLNEAAWKNDEQLLPEEWYCIRLLRISGTQIVMHMTFSRSEGGVEELRKNLMSHFKSWFPDEKDQHYQREAHNM